MNRTAFYYDNRSNLRCVLDPDNDLTYYTHDSLNRMTSVKNPWGEVTYYDWSPGGRLLKRVLGNGTIAYYAYDAVGQVSKVQNVKSNLTTISSFEYQRNALGSPVSIKREDNSVTYYEYDAKEQLTKETQVNGQGQQVYGWTWDYDLAGNRLHQTFNGVTTAYTCNAANELTQETTAGATTYYSYDHCGNTTAKTEPGGTTQYHWDRENLMTQVDLPTGGHNYFAYDADGKRVEKRDGDGYTRFIYQGPDMLKLLQERDGNDARQAQYTMGNGLEAMRRGGVSSFYHFDWLGSTFELTNAAQTVTDTYLYNAWGEVIARTGTTVNPHLYVGRERYYRALAAGLYLLGRRYYGSCAGRFISVDPQREGLHWYAYARNSPAGSVDPEGLEVLGRGSATCDYKLNPERGLPTVSCNVHPENRCCPRFKVGLTGAWPNIWFEAHNVGCKYSFHRDNQPKYPRLLCGNKVDVKLKLGNRQGYLYGVTIIDDGPHHRTGKMIDLHPLAAKLASEILGLPWDDTKPHRSCEDFGVADVEVSTPTGGQS